MYVWLDIINETSYTGNYIIGFLLSKTKFTNYVCMYIVGDCNIRDLKIFLHKYLPTQTAGLSNI